MRMHFVLFGSTELDIAPSHPTALNSTLVAPSHATSLASTELDIAQDNNVLILFPERKSIVEPILLLKESRRIDAVIINGARIVIKLFKTMGSVEHVILNYFYNVCSLSKYSNPICFASCCPILIRNNLFLEWWPSTQSSI